MLSHDMAQALRSPHRDLCWLAWFQRGGDYYQDFSRGQGDWTSSNATIVQDDAGIVLTETGADPVFRAGVSFSGATNPYVIIDIERLSGAGAWQGSVFYGTEGGHGESGSFYKSFAAILAGERIRLAIDMRTLTAGGTDWTDNTITRLRFDFSSGASAAFLIRSIRVGQPDLFFWSGMQSVTWDAATWLGVGYLSSVSTIDKGDALSWRQQQFSLNGLDPQVLAGMDESVQGRQAKLWLASRNSSGQIIRDPHLVAHMEQDTMQREVNVGDGTIKLTLNCFEALPRFDKATGKKWSHESQLERFAGDTGFYYTQKIARTGQPIDWRLG